MFSQVSVCPGGVADTPSGQAHPPGQVHPTLGRYNPLAGTPPGRYTPWQAAPPRQVPPQAGTPPGQVHPQAGTPPPGRRSTSGWYASWNAFLLLFVSDEEYTFDINMDIFVYLYYRTRYVRTCLPELTFECFLIEF